MHNCSGCEHDLHYCRCCNKVYCSKCGQEWGGCYPTTTVSPYTVTYMSGNVQ